MYLTDKIAKSIIADITPIHINDYNEVANIWRGSVVHQECTLHQVSPYIGKMKSAMAKALVSTFSNPGEFIYDPFCGSGTVALEAWSASRNIIANDLSPYALTLTKAKLYPPEDLESALRDIEKANYIVLKTIKSISLEEVPPWVQSFYHPDTLREIIAWSNVLKQNDYNFLMACMLGILHHQRPGFLSYPSSHTVPYLRINKYPQSEYPELYTYRSVKDRLERKVIRSLKRVPILDRTINRECHLCDANGFIPKFPIDTIITSPPYMHQLDYGRDNRLRLWYLGVTDWKALDFEASPSEKQFLSMLESCFRHWKSVLRKNGLCILVIGDNKTKSCGLSLPEVISNMVINNIGGFSLIWQLCDSIPDIRRVRRGYCGNLSETILVFRYVGG